VFVVGTAVAQKGDDPSSSAEQSSTSAGDYATVTVALAIGLGAILAVLVIILVVAVVRRVHTSRSKNIADHDQQGAAAAVSTVTAPTTSGSSTRFTGSLPTWGFDSIRSKYSITSEASVDDDES